MIILVKSDSDVLEAYADARNYILYSNRNCCNSNGDFAKKSGLKNTVNASTIVTFSTILRILKFSKFIRLNALKAYCFAAQVVSSDTDSKKDKFFFGVKLFGLILLGIPLALSVTALMLPVALVSHSITYLIGKIKRKPEEPKAQSERKVTIEELMAKGKEMGSNPATLKYLLSLCRAPPKNHTREDTGPDTNSYDQDTGYDADIDEEEESKVLTPVPHEIENDQHKNQQSPTETNISESVSSEAVKPIEKVEMGAV